MLNVWMISSPPEIADTLCYLLVGTSEEEMHGVEVCLSFVHVSD